MAITIQMIETKEFKVKPNGYDPEEVDVFLDSIIDEFEDLQHEIQSLRTAAARPAKPAAPAIPESTETAQKLLANAQRVSDETMADARKQAESIIADAKVQADRLVRDAQKEATRLQDSLETLRSAAGDYRDRFKRLVDDQMHLLNGDTELFE